MGFFEDDRIRRKNAVYNFPTPQINKLARDLIKTKTRLEIISIRENALFAHDDEAAKITETALIILDKGL